VGSYCRSTNLIEWDDWVKFDICTPQGRLSRLDQLAPVPRTGRNRG